MLHKQVKHLDLVNRPYFLYFFLVLVPFINFEFFGLPTNLSSGSFEILFPTTLVFYPTGEVFKRANILLLRLTWLNVKKNMFGHIVINICSVVVYDLGIYLICSVTQHSPRL